ncbi:MAG TPA: metallophosphoesterase, partial [Candidatus Sabulitectum sp.]|nr:metallophosphoesterase [Candidatus Sabulitectum sp.]
MGRVFLTSSMALICAGAYGYTLDIVHVNDTHSNLEPVGLRLDCPGDSTSFNIASGSAAAIAQGVESIREEGGNVLFLHAGDLVQGTLFYTVYDGRADAAVYNDIMPDAMVTGNHEFDRGSQGLRFLLDLVEFPVICANLDLSGDSLLAGLVQPFVIIEKGGESIGIVGVVTEELASVSSPSAETVVLPAAETVQSVIDRLTESGIDKIVVLSHMGYENDLELAMALSGADVIVGGHSHTLLGDFTSVGLESSGGYPAVLQGADGGTVLVVQAWSYTRVLGHLQVEFDGGEIVSYAGMPRILAGEHLFGGEDPIPECLIAEHSVEVTPGDQFVQGLVDTYGEVIAEYEQEAAATAPEDLPNQRVPGGTLPQGSMIAPLVCDAMLWKANQLGSGADIALQNAGGVRIDIPAGEITVGTVYRLL